MVVALTLLFPILLFIGLGIYLLQGKGGFLIAGYNTMSKEEQAQYDEEALCRFTGKNILVIAGSMVFYIIGFLLDNNVFFIIGTIIMIGTCIYMVVRMNSGDRFKKKI